MYYKIRTNFLQDYWPDYHVEQKLKSLSTLNKSKGWVRWDLSVRKSSFVSRLFWKIIKRFWRLRAFFFKVNLEKSKYLLLDLERNLEPHHKLFPLFQKAVENFNTIAPKHKVFLTEDEEEDEGEICPIFLSPIQEREEVPCCNKGFEKKALIQALKSKPECPCCRKDLSSFRRVIDPSSVYYTRRRWR